MKRWKVLAFLTVFLCLVTGAEAAGGLSLDGGSIVVTGPAGINTTDDVALTSGTLQCIGNAQFQVGGNWSLGNSSLFLPDQSTVFLNGDSTLSGSSTFYNLIGTHSGQTLTLLVGSTQSVTNSFTMSGSSGLVSKIHSSVFGAFAALTNPGSNTLSYLDVEDINSFGGQVLNAGPHSTLTHTINWSYGGALLTPQLVTQVRGTGGTNALTYLWAPVITYSDGSLIQEGIGATYEISRYATLSDLSNGSLTAAGVIGNAYGSIPTTTADSLVYYGIRAVVNNVKSDPFYVDNNPSPDYAFPSTNGNGYVYVPAALQGAFAGTSIPYFWLGLTTQVNRSSSDILASGSLQINIRGPGSAPADYHFPAPGVTMVLNATAAPPPAQDSFPVQMDVDGTWKTVGTAAYSQVTNAFTFTVYQTGLYRVGVDAGTGQSAILQSVHPRLFSPNGDGYNDFVSFDLINPDQEPVSGEIFDLQAAKVAALAPAPLGLRWDGKGPGGRVVPGGVYIYQIHVGNRRVNGTVVVVK